MTKLPNNPYVTTMQETVKEIEDRGGDVNISHEVFATLANAYEVNALCEEMRIANLQRERDFAISEWNTKLVTDLTNTIKKHLELYL